MVNGLFLFTFKIDADWPTVNNVTISKMADSEMHHFGWLRSDVTLYHFEAMPPCFDSPWQLS